MKTLLVIFLVCIFVYSCRNPSEYSGSENTIQIPKDTLYKQAKDLKGIGPIFIGMSVKNIKQINKTTDEYDINNLPFEIPWEFNGNGTYGKKHLPPNLKEYESHSYMIGDFKISNVKLYFYKDTLYKIYIENHIDAGNIREVFSLKYGNGKEEISFYKNSHNILNENKTNIWENQNIIAKYVEVSPKIPSFISEQAKDKWFDEKYRLGSNYEWFSIETKSKRILDAVEECKSSQRNKENEAKLKKEKETMDLI